jgi:hypothetical protein
VTREKIIVAQVIWEDTANDGRKAGDPLNFPTDFWAAMGLPAPERWNEKLEGKAAFVKILVEKEVDR